MTGLLDSELPREIRCAAMESHDKCTVCSTIYKSGEYVNFGFLPEKKPAYCCDSCAEGLATLVKRAPYAKRKYEIPERTSVLWRYVDFTKYISLISTKGLHFSRADQFNDLHEGAKGYRRFSHIWDESLLTALTEGFKNASSGNSDAEKIAQTALRAVKHYGEISRYQTFINCWHENQGESMAMWHLYSHFLPNAVAIRTTYEKLYQALGCNPDIEIGRVKYQNFDTFLAGVYEAYWVKRKSFEYEHEVRAIMFDQENDATGIIVPCNLNVLIDRLYVSPEAPQWFVDIVSDVNKKFGIDVDVSKSGLLEEPFY